MCTDAILIVYSVSAAIICFHRAKIGSMLTVMQLGTVLGISKPRSTMVLSPGSNNPKLHFPEKFVYQKVSDPRGLRGN